MPVGARPHVPAGTPELPVTQQLSQPHAHSQSSWGLVLAEQPLALGWPQVSPGTLVIECSGDRGSPDKGWHVVLSWAAGKGRSHEMPMSPKGERVWTRVCSFPVCKPGQLLLEDKCLPGPGPAPAAASHPSHPGPGLSLPPEPPGHLSGPGLRRTAPRSLWLPLPTQPPSQALCITASNTSWSFTNYKGHAQSPISKAEEPQGHKDERMLTALARGVSV